MGDSKSNSCISRASQIPELRALIRLFAELVADDLAAEHCAEPSAIPAVEAQNEPTQHFDDSS